MNRFFYLTLSAAFALVPIMVAPTTVHAQGADSVTANELASTPNPFKYEPSAAQTVRKALEYFRVSPNADLLRCKWLE